MWKSKDEFGFQTLAELQTFWLWPKQLVLSVTYDSCHMDQLEFFSTAVLVHFGSLCRQKPRCSAVFRDRFQNGPCVIDVTFIPPPPTLFAYSPIRYRNDIFLLSPCDFFTFMNLTMENPVWICQLSTSWVNIYIIHYMNAAIHFNTFTHINTFFIQCSILYQRASFSVWQTLMFA